MKYNRDICNYSTNDKSHFNRHNLSKSHKDRIITLNKMNQF